MSRDQAPKGRLGEQAKRAAVKHHGAESRRRTARGTVHNEQACEAQEERALT